MEIKEFLTKLEKENIFFIWVCEPEDLYLNFDKKEGVKLTVYDRNGKVICKNEIPFKIKNVSGIYGVFIESEKQDFIKIIINKNAFPFVLPGFGLVPSHFDHDFLKFWNKEFQFWTYIPEKINKIIVQTTVKDKDIEIIFPSGKIEKLEFLTCKGSPYRTAIVENLIPGWYGFEGKTENVPYRFLIYGGFPLFFEKPEKPFKYKKLNLKILDEKGKPVNSNLKFIFLNEPFLNYNKISSNKSSFYIPDINFSVYVSSGFNYKEIISPLKEKIKIENFFPEIKGWVCGDLHMHSCINSDGAEPPEIIAETAICNGLNYIFISDNPEILKRCEKYNKNGKFLILPGQEVSTPDVHMNILNGKIDFQKFADINDTRNSIKKWIEKIKEEKNSCIMLNHPSHLPEVSKNYGYFRSWWVVDEFEEIRIVENFDFETWFKKLNEGKKITGLWTTDTHDSSLIPPGFKRSYVYTGEKFDEKNLIEGIKKGNVFCSRYPGAIIDFKINGAIPGETVYIRKNENLKIEIYCASKRPIKFIELIGDGEKIAEIDGKKASFIKEKIYILPEYKWIIARVYVYEEEWRKDGHSIEPLVASGCVAFTNPIWINLK